MKSKALERTLLARMNSETADSNCTADRQPAHDEKH